MTTAAPAKTAITTAVLDDPTALTGIDYAPAGAMYPDWKGLNYDSNMPVAEIVAIVRTELRKAMKAGKLGTVTKVSVRKRLSTHKWAIDVTLTVPETKVTADTPGAVLAYDTFGDEVWAVFPEGARYATAGHADTLVPGAREARAKATAFLATFNHDRSDSMTDYYDTKFYSSVLIEEAR